jgi:hypothetical protein
MLTLLLLFESLASGLLQKKFNSARTHSQGLYLARHYPANSLPSLTIAMLPPLNLARTYCPFQTCALDHLKRTCQIRIQSFPTISSIRNRFFLRRDSETPGGRVEGLSILRRERENTWIDTSRHYPQRQRLCTDSDQCQEKRSCRRSLAKGLEK